MFLQQLKHSSTLPASFQFAVISYLLDFKLKFSLKRPYSRTKEPETETSLYEAKSKNNKNIFTKIVKAE